VAMPITPSKIISKKNRLIHFIMFEKFQSMW